jgi:hypothetical protein
VKDEVSASTPRRVVDRPPPAEAPEARASAEARPERIAANLRKLPPPVRAKHPAGKAEAPRAGSPRSVASAPAAEPSSPTPAVSAEPPRHSTGSTEAKKRAQLVDDQARVKLLE